MKQSTKDDLKSLAAGVALAVVFLLCMMSTAWAQSCPPFASGVYTAQLPNQSSSCYLDMTAVPPELAIGSLKCEGANPGDVSVVTPITPDDDGVCRTHVRISTGGVLVASEGEPVRIGRFAGGTFAVVTDDPQYVCEVAAAEGLLHSDRYETLWVAAVNIVHNPDNPVTTFACTGDMDKWGGFSFGTVPGGRIDENFAEGDAYLEADVTIRASMATVEGLGSVDSASTSTARVITRSPDGGPNWALHPGAFSSSPGTCADGDAFSTCLP